jgi:chloride channel 3/4/5
MKDYARNQEYNDLNWLEKSIGSMQTWILLTLIGIAVGLLISWIDVVTAFLSDIKHGVCSSDWYLSKDICCKGLVRDGLYCDDYKSWSIYLFGSSLVPLDFLLYASLSVFLGTLSSFLVVNLSMYSSDSGLPEIKTILGGFIIHGFFSLKTMVVKSISLSLALASGLCIGKEAVMIHLACCVGHNIQLLFPAYKDNEVRKRQILSGCIY